MTHKPEKALTTEEELDAFQQSNGFRLVKSDFTKDFEAYLLKHGSVSTPLVTQLPDGGLLPYAILNPQPELDAKQLTRMLNDFLNEHGVVMNCTCTKVSGGAMVINAFLYAARTREERLKITRHRRQGRTKSKE